jgi:hypothetical protein
VVITLDGLPKEQGHVLADDFVRELQLLLAALAKAEASIGADRGSGIYYRVVDLSHDSPARVVLEAVSPAEADIDVRQVFSVVSTALRAVGKSRISETTDYDLMSDLAGLASPVGRSVGRLSLVLGTSKHAITREIHVRASQMLARVETRVGTVTGMLDAINIHGAARLFRIYPVVGAQKISCSFPESLKATAIAGIGRYVRVRGMLSYRPLARHAHSLEVQGIEVMPETTKVPSLRSLRGVFPDLTGGAPSEVYVGRLRDAEG